MPLPSNDRGIHIQTHTDERDFLINPLIRLRSRDINSKFRKDWFKHSKVNRGDTQTAALFHMPTLFFQNKESRLKINKCQNEFIKIVVYLHVYI
jgi:hypothetical protein